MPLVSNQALFGALYRRNFARGIQPGGARCRTVPGRALHQNPGRTGGGDDDLAKKRGLMAGKTEMWYMLDSEKDPEIIVGFNKEINKGRFKSLLEKKNLKSVLNFENVKRDDVFYVPAGRIHAIGPGTLLAEIQQTSDTTYRVYDWDRIDIDRAMRELHIDEARNMKHNALTIIFLFKLLIPFIFHLFIMLVY